MIKKFVAVVQEGDGGPYDTVIDGYERGVVMGQPQTIEELLELMAIKHQKLHEKHKTSEAMADLGAVNQCAHCKKQGHLESACWVKHPEMKPRSQKRNPTKRAG